MTSQTGFSSNMMFQSINDDLNASLATADELSREFSSLLHEVTPPPQPDHQQTSSFYAPATSSSSSSASSSSIQRDMLLSVTPSITTTASSPTSPPTSFPGSPVSYSGSPVSYSGSLTGSSSASRMSGPQLLSPGIRQLTPSPLSSPQLQSDGLSPLSRYSAPFDSYGQPQQPQQQQQQRSPMQSPRSQRRPSPSHYDPGSMGRRSPRPGQLSMPTASASIHREQQQQQQQQQQRSPNQSPRSPRRSSPRHSSPRHGSPSHYNRSPRGSTGYADTSPSPSPTSPAASFDLLQRGRAAQQMHPLAAGCPPPHDPGSMGRRLPRHDRSPSPCVRLGAPTASTLPRNFGGLLQAEEGVQRQKKAGRWNETDLDATFDGKPHHTYDTTEWMRPAVPSSNWRESNLDGPSPAPSPKKDTPSGSSYSHSSLPRSTRITVPPDAPPLSPYHVQPIIGRICIPPANVGPRQRRPIPLSVIMRLQNPHWATAPMAPPWGQGYGDIPAQPPLSETPLSETPPLSAFQPAFYGEVLSSGDVDAELEKLDLVHMPAIPEFAGGSKQGGASEGAPPTAAAPRPLSPTRLQPVVAPQVQQVPDLEELLRIRAEIPRALKRRGSVDQSQPLKKASHYQPNQYKHLINKLFRRKGLQQRGEERGSDSSDEESLPPTSPTSPVVTPSLPPQDYPGYHSILRRNRKQQRAAGRRARLTPLVLLLDGALVGELETVQRAVQEMSDPSQPNDEGITALHNAICGGHYNVVDFLVRIGANVSAPDSHGWTPLHCSASCNDRHLCEFLVRNGAAVMAVTESDGATAALKCDPYALGYEECESFLRGVEEAMGADNSGVLYALWSYPAQAADELSFREGDMVTILQRADGVDWWWASLCGREGFVPNNYFGLFPKVRPKSLC